MARIVFVSPHFWPEQIGSAPYCTDLAQWLSAKGHDVTVLAFRPHYPSVSEFADWQDGSRDGERCGDDLDVVRVATRGRQDGGLRARAMNDLRFMARAAGSALHERFAAADAIFAFVPSSLSLFGAKVMALRSGARLIGVVHDIESGLASSLGFSSSPMLLNAVRASERSALNLCDELVVLTDGMKQELQRLKCRKPIRVLPLWCEASAGYVDKAGRFTIAYSGNFGKKQNLDQLIPLFEAMHAERLEVDVHLRGDGSERQRLKAIIEAKGLDEVQFLPLVDADKLTEAIQAADVHLVPQAPNIGNYAIPSKAFTIMAAGRPFVCIAEKGTELASLAVNSGAGLSVEPNDASGLQQAVRLLYRDRDLARRMGQSALHYVRTRLGRTEILEQYEALLEPVAPPAAAVYQH